MFGGGFNVGINVNANKIIYNDILTQVVDLLTTFKVNNKKTIFKAIEEIIDEYDLPTTKPSEQQELEFKERYLKLRNDYNNLIGNGFQKNILFYTLICHSFSNQIRFNSKNEFNLPYGKRHFNRNLRENLEIFLDKLHNLNDVGFYNLDFNLLQLDVLNKNDFVYSDPPYLITCATYNEKNGWNERYECKLLGLLDKLNDQGVKFALSNVLESKGKSNDILKQWSKKYIVNRLNVSYGNANYQRKDKSKDSSLEVLITNYNQ